MNYRGKQHHSFLIISRNRRPLSVEGGTKIFQKITASLPKHLRKLLVDLSLTLDCLRSKFEFIFCFAFALLGYPY
jgi:hypothetical protein